MAPLRWAPSSRRRCDWSSLPDLVVFNVAARLDTIHFYALAGVCKSWRTIFTQNKAHILALNDTACKLYSFPDRRLYSKPLPPRFQLLVGTRQLGCYHGYVLLYSLPHLGRNNIYLANPFTEDLVVLPLITFLVRSALLTAPPVSADSVIVAVIIEHIMVCRPGVDESWSSIHFLSLMPQLNRYQIKQAVFFKGHVYIVTHDAVVTVEVKFGRDGKAYVKRFATFCIREQPVFDISHYLAVRNGCCPLWLFAGEEELFIVELVLKIFPNASKMKRMYRLRDIEGRIWEEVESLGRVTMFATRGSEFVPGGHQVTGWEQRGEEDRVFIVVDDQPFDIRPSSTPFCHAPCQHILIGFLRANSSEFQALNDTLDFW